MSVWYPSIYLVWRPKTLVQKTSLWRATGQTRSYRIDSRHGERWRLTLLILFQINIGQPMCASSKTISGPIDRQSSPRMHWSHCGYGIVKSSPTRLLTNAELILPVATPHQNCQEEGLAWLFYFLFSYHHEAAVAALLIEGWNGSVSSLPPSGTCSAPLRPPPFRWNCSVSALWKACVRVRSYFHMGSYDLLKLRDTKSLTRTQFSFSYLLRANIRGGTIYRTPSSITSRKRTRCTNWILLRYNGCKHTYLSE